MSGGDCSRLNDGGIRACYICWLVGLMVAVLMLAVIVQLLGVLQIWLRHPLFECKCCGKNNTPILLYGTIICQ